MFKLKEINKVFSVGALFEGTLAKDIYHPKDLEYLVPNYIGEMPLKVFEVNTDEYVNHDSDWCGDLENAYSFMMKMLAEFFEGSGKDYQKLMNISPELYQLAEKSFLLARQGTQYNKLSRGVYGNFDFTVDDKNKVKIYEYNGQTPVLLYEPSVIQDMIYNNLTEVVEQWNNVHEYTVSLFKRLSGVKKIHFVGLFDHMNDTLTMETLAHAANIAGVVTEYLDITKDVEYDIIDNCYFVAGTEERITNMFLLFPFEDLPKEFINECNKCYDVMLKDPAHRGTVISEPFYKVILSNKVFLAWMFEKDFYGSLQAGFIPTYRFMDAIDGGDRFVGKPAFGRMSSNIIHYQKDTTGEVRILNSASGEYNDDQFVYQLYQPMLNKDHDLGKEIDNGVNIVFRCWMTPCGISSAEATTLVVRATDNNYNMEIESEHMLPHAFV